MLSTKKNKNDENKNKNRAVYYYNNKMQTRNITRAKKNGVDRTWAHKRDTRIRPIRTRLRVIIVDGAYQRSGR